MPRLARLAAFACLLAGSPALASDPVGVYALATRVVFEPPGSDATSAKQVQVHGVFAIATGRPGDGDVYRPPQRGYMYYSCMATHEPMCQLEWTDIAKSVGTGECVGYGNRYIYEQNGRVRPDGEAPGSPEVYPSGFSGAQRTTMQQCPNLLAFASGARDQAAPAPVDMAVGPGTQLGMGCSAARGTARSDALGLGLLALLGMALGALRRIRE